MLHTNLTMHTWFENLEENYNAIDSKDFWELKDWFSNYAQCTEYWEVQASEPYPQEEYYL